MKFQLSEAFLIIDSLDQHATTYIRVTMFEERRVIRNRKSEKIVYVMKAEILKEAVFTYLPTTLCEPVCFGLN